MKQQTAVEWLIEQIESKGIDCGSGILMKSQVPKDIAEQAKQIEKEQNRKDYYAGVEGFIVKDGGFQQYYNETYGKK